MKPLRVLIVDDEAPARNRLRVLLVDCAATLPTEVVGEAGDGAEAIRLLGETAVDVILLDIRMPGMDGLEVALHAQKLPQPPAIVFTTAYDVYAMKAFDLNAIDYLLKPIRSARLSGALQKARALTAARMESLNELAKRGRTHLSVYERGKILLVPVGDIVYLRAELKYTTLRTPTRELLLDESLTKIEQEFSELLLRIHRKFLVAKPRIKGFERTALAAESEESGTTGWVVLLDGTEEKLPISRRQQYIVKQFGHGGSV
ncbi:MAG: LytR/AlgR family response regulator transcription factor [Burkholderiales bacterium]